MILNPPPEAARWVYFRPLDESYHFGERFEVGVVRTKDRPQDEGLWGLTPSEWDQPSEAISRDVDHFEGPVHLCWAKETN